MNNNRRMAAWTVLAIAMIYAALVISMIATKQTRCPPHLRRGQVCHTTYWFNR